MLSRGTSRNLQELESKKHFKMNEFRYYFAGRDATEELFLSPSTFNYLEQRISVINRVVSGVGAGNKVWLGERVFLIDSI